MIRRIGLVSALVGLWLAAGASPASAAVTLGQTFTPNSGCSGDNLFQQASLAQQYSAPSAGVITSWAFQADSSAPSSLKFKVGRPTGGNDYTIVGESASVNPTPDTLNTYETRISAQAGDQIGFFVAADAVRDCAGLAPAGNVIVFLAGDQPLGATETFETQDQRLLDVSAVLEPDADNDGFGDETQDKCPSIAATHGPCNSFTLGATTRNKKKGTATISVNLPNPGELSGSGNGAKVASTRAVTSKSVGAGQAQLLIKAKGKKKKKLNQKGKVKLDVAITYTPTGGDPRTQSVKVKLKKNLKK